MRNSTATHRTTLLTDLRELVEALDRRQPQLQRVGETSIAGDAALLKQQAQDRIAALLVEDDAQE